MKKNNKFPASILMLTIYALFMCQEIIVNQVLCVKGSGNADIELAIFGFQCECKKEDSLTHPDHPETNTLEQICPQCFDCFDLPLENTWVKRIVNNPTFEINFVKQCDVDNQIFLQLDNPFLRFPESVPKSKFLFISLSPVDTVVLRC